MSDMLDIFSSPNQGLPAFTPDVTVPDVPPEPSATDSPFPAAPVAVPRKRKLWEWAWDIALTTGIIRASFSGKKTLVKLIVALVAAIAAAVGIAFGIAGAWLFMGKGDSKKEEGGPESDGADKGWWWSIIRDYPYDRFVRPPVSPAKVASLLDNPKSMIRAALPYVNLQLIPLATPLRKPFLIITAYYESYGLGTAVGAALERGLWQVNSKRFEIWRTANNVTTVQFEGSPRLQAALLNDYLKLDFLPNWRASTTRKSSGLTLLDRLTPKMPSEYKIGNACILWMNGPDPKNKYTSAVRVAAGLTRALSVMLLLLKKNSIADLAAALPRTEATMATAMDIDAAMSGSQRTA